jgi:type IV pilus assembly protein PilP
MKKTTYIFLVFLLIFSAGCKKEQTVVQKPAAGKVMPTQTTEEKKVSQETKVETESYQYDAKGKRDPFLSLAAVAKQKPAKKKGASPFESHEIDEMELLAIAWDKNKYYALIMLPDKKTYTITEGMTLGMLGGKVQKISKDAVHIREYVKDYRGDIKPRDAILKLHKGEE